MQVTILRQVTIPVSGHNEKLSDKSLCVSRIVSVQVSDQTALQMNRCTSVFSYQSKHVTWVSKRTGSLISP